jgi:chloramphenicol 3-O-phosphotransferase
MTNDVIAPQTSQAGIIILSGPPGSGKTTVGRVLAETAERPTARLVTDSFYVAIKKGFVPPFLPEAVRQNEVVIGVVVESMLGYAKGGLRANLQPSDQPRGQTAQSLRSDQGPLRGVRESRGA